ncbi:MAG: TonB-dependent receptor [Lysobacterales bacterium 69-70]|nr:TonB-dependent receptor [Xanthomonadaceae bacterium]ODU33785.1 MAG: TonB-dependent receptor [Xanthomonadaceae bacterium SCN 69-320]ODV21041.1 MAG: TonB-dependent receptor [Xanthomonadaceae bacterium SCN 69-25]OJY99269.1 MAG: TonB-dependent receptor [Xanthomonadales bacterium 69-70]
MKPIRRQLVASLRQALLVSLTAASLPAFAQPTDAEDNLLERVVVTAQSREQELQEVPIAIQVVDEKLITETTAYDLQDIDSFVPGLVVSGQKTQPYFAIRGISTGDFGIGTDPAVGVYIDGVYSARSGGSVLAFNDVERIEVLKGPQGTLFGRNSAAGAVSLISKQPGRDLEGRVTTRVGNDGQRYVDGLINTPLGDTTALRVSVLRNESDGWLRDAATGRDLNGDDNWAARAAFRWDLSNSTNAVLTWDHERLDQLARPAIGIVPLPASPDWPPSPPDPATYLDPRHAPVFNDVEGNEESRTFNGATLAINHDADWGHLTSTTAWRKFDTVNREDEDGTNRRYLYLDTANIEDNRSFYQELKFSGDTGTVNWVAGASYYREKANQTSQVNVFTDSLDTLIRNQGLAPTPDGTLFGYFSDVLASFDAPFSLRDHRWREEMINSADSRAYALFGDTIWSLGDSTHFTVGLRYTRDEKKFSWLNGPRIAPTLDTTIQQLLPLVAQLPPELQEQALFALGVAGSDIVFANGALEGIKVRDSTSWSDLSPRFVLDHQLSPDTLLFASLAKGYKAGGYNSLDIGAKFDNEDVWNLEAGFKQVDHEHGLMWNASAFYYIYSDRQAIRLDPNSAGSGVPRYLVDTSDEKAWGIDAGVQWQPVRALSLDANLAFIDATYKDKVAPSGADLSGQATGEPYLSFSLGGSYRWDFGSAGAMTLSLRHAYRGKSRCNADSQLQGDCSISPNFDVGAAQQRTDLRLGWTDAGDHWHAAAFATNLFDKRYVEGVGNYTTDVFGTTYATISPPRMYGVELGYKF